MITLKSAFRSVVRRPQQNIAVILGIALGVSLFVGVQVGSDSLSSGLNEITIHAIGERDAEISPSFTPFFLSQDVINEELSPFPLNNTPLIDSLRSTNSYNEYVDAMTERLILPSTVLQPETGSIEVGQRLTGVDENQDPVFGELLNQDNKKIKISDLKDHQVYIGEGVVETLFEEGEDPIGKNITVQTTLFTQSQPLLNITSVAVPLSLELNIADVFIDEGLGGEMFSNFIITPLHVLQQNVVNTYNQAKFAAFAQNQTLLGYGSTPISTIYIAWKDGVQIGDESSAAVEEITNDLQGIVGELFIELFSVSDTRAQLQEQIGFATDSLELLLNAFGYIIILAGVLVIVNIQSMALAARERETGILRAVGAKRRQIVILNLLEAVFLGVLGSVVGLAGGIVYGRLLVFFLGVAFDFPSDLFPVVVELDTMISSFTAGFILSLITGLLPAINASRINIARVLRGIDAPPQETYGKKTLYLGLTLTIVAFLGIISLDPNPILDGNDAFKQLEDVQSAYLPIVLLISGPALLIAYFRNFRLGLSTVGLALLGWAYFNIFYIVDQIDQSSPGSGDTNGLWYVVYLAGSLLIGSVVVMAVNLGSLAAIGQRLASWVARSSKTPIRGTTMVAFRKMRSKVTRSTLTFALFATILTLNIWIGTFSYSFRYGLDAQTQALTGGSDIILYTPDNLMPLDLDFPQKILDEFGDTNADVYVTESRGYMITPSSSYFWDKSDPLTAGNYKGVSLSQDAFWSSNEQSDWIFKMDLQENKTGTPFEINEGQGSNEFDVQATIEDEDVWKAVANNETIPNQFGEQMPIVVTTQIFSFDESGFALGPQQGESIFLNLTDGSLQEFVIASVSPGSPLSDYANSGPGGGSGFGGGGGSPLDPTIFVSEAWKNKLLAFSGYAQTENTFLLSTNVETDSNDLSPFLLEIEKWCNAGEFKDEFGLFGVIGLTTYSIYEAQLESGYQFFQFLQAFVSLGFAVGILGLLVVASRSVAERKREIGMLRALGFRSRDIVVSVVLELIVLGMIGLFLGFINGVVMGYALTNVFGGVVQFRIPWNTVVLYGVATLFSAIFAAIIPAMRASRIPASDALRYTG